MGVRAALTLAVTTAGLVVGLLACFDLFHSTSDVLTACQLDPQTAGCVDAGPPDAPVDFCSWTHAQARLNAQRTCAWLGACETPMGRNAFGPCLFEALLAYDCAANPSHPVQGKTRELWACLARAANAQTCAQVDACVFPHGAVSCSDDGDYVSCATGGTPALGNLDVRVECDNGIGSPAHGENCALFGQTCASATCGGRGAGGEAAGCTTNECDGTELHFCDDAGDDIGIDCADNGAATCNGFPLVEPMWLACLPLGLADAAVCTPSDSAQCAAGVATSCPTGVPETIDCAALLLNGNACTPGPLSPTFDWTSPCAVPSGLADADCVESCGGSQVTGCARNAAFTVDCQSVGLGPCVMVTTDQDSGRHPACAKP